jgi:hypothetical protein
MRVYDLDLYKNFRNQALSNEIQTHLQSTNLIPGWKFLFPIAFEGKYACHKILDFESNSMI